MDEFARFRVGQSRIAQQRGLFRVSQENKELGMTAYRCCTSSAKVVVDIRTGEFLAYKILGMVQAGR